MNAILTINTIADLAKTAILANARHGALCEAGASEAEMAATLRDYADAMTRLAAERTVSETERRDKAAALKTALISTNGTLTVEGDFGLAASLTRDLIG